MAQQLPRIVHHAGAGARQCDAARMVADEDGKTDYRLQLEYGREDRGLRDVQVAGCLGDVARVGGGHDVAQHAERDGHRSPGTS
jgi:hypothetical protein